MTITGSREGLLDLHLAGGVQRPGDRQDLHRRQVPDHRQAQLRRQQHLRSAAGCTPTCRRSPPGNGTVLFLADIPDQVRLLTIYGKLKMGFRNASGEEVVFDVPQAPPTPNRGLSEPAPGMATTSGSARSTAAVTSTTRSTRATATRSTRRRSTADAFTISFDGSHVSARPDADAGAGFRNRSYPVLDAWPLPVPATW